MGKFKIEKLISQDAIMNLAGATGGNIGARVVVNKLLAKQTWKPAIKNAIPLILGLVLSGQKNKLLAAAGAGMASQAGVSIAAGFIPGIEGIYEPDISEIDGLFDTVNDRSDEMNDDISDDMADEISDYDEDDSAGAFQISDDISESDM